MKQICQHLSRPRFEVLQWPEEELEYWACYFSIDQNQDKPILPEPKLDDAKASLKELMR